MNIRSIHHIDINIGSNNKSYKVGAIMTTHFTGKETEAYRD